MNDKLLIHPRTKQALESLVDSKAHCLLIVGPAGIGKAALALHILAQWSSNSVQALLVSPYNLHITKTATDHISIEIVRHIEHFLSRKVPKAAKRTVLIEEAAALTGEAQNALLKILEEPPADVMFVLTADSANNVLPTIRSRSTIVSVIRPSSKQFQQFFEIAGYTSQAIDRAELMSGGLPGLAHSLLSAGKEHPLTRAAETARDCMQKSSFERLCLVESLTRDRQLSLDTLYILQQMAHVALAKGSSPRSWQSVLQASYEAEQQLRQNAQPKLTLINLMLQLTV